MQFESNFESYSSSAFGPCCLVDVISSCPLQVEANFISLRVIQYQGSQPERPYSMHMS